MEPTTGTAKSRGGEELGEFLSKGASRIALQHFSPCRRTDVMISGADHVKSAALTEEMSFDSLGRRDRHSCSRIPGSVCIILCYRPTIRRRIGSNFPYHANGVTFDLQPS
jgi:hypothetical protein